MKCTEIFKERSSLTPSLLMVSRPTARKAGILHKGVARPSELQKSHPHNSQLLSSSSMCNRVFAPNFKHGLCLHFEEPHIREVGHRRALKKIHQELLGPSHMALC